MTGPWTAGSSPRASPPNPDHTRCHTRGHEARGVVDTAAMDTVGHLQYQVEYQFGVHVGGVATAAAGVADIDDGFGDRRPVGLVDSFNGVGEVLQQPLALPAAPACDTLRPVVEVHDNRRGDQVLQSLDRVLAREVEEALGGHADRLLEHGEEQLVLVAEVAVKGLECDSGAIDHLPHGEVENLVLLHERPRPR